MKLTDRKLTKIFFSSEIHIKPDNPKLETGTNQIITSRPSSTHQPPNPCETKNINHQSQIQHHRATCEHAGVRTREPERRAQSWGRLQMIGIRTTTNVNDIDRRRGSPSTGGDQLQKPSLQELQHQSTLKARLRQSFQARRLFRTPSCQPRATTSGVRFDHRLQDRPSFEHRDHRESNQDIQIRRLREPRDTHAHQTSKSEGCEMTHFLREN